MSNITPTLLATAQSAGIGLSSHDSLIARMIDLLGVHDSVSLLNRLHAGNNTSGAFDHAVLIFFIAANHLEFARAWWEFTHPTQAALQADAAAHPTRA